MSNINCSDIWLGIGAKTGGSLIVGGYEDVTGMIFNVGNISNRLAFSKSGFRFGPGLGGGGGIVAMCVFNCQDIWKIHNKVEWDVDFNLSIGEKWDALVKSLSKIKFFVKVAKIGPKLKGGFESIEEIIEGLHKVKDCLGVIGDEPTVITFATPLSGGIEVSLSYTRSKIQIY